VGVILTLAMKPQWVRYKLDKTNEQPCSDFLTHTSDVCKGAHRYNEYSAIHGQSQLMRNVYSLYKL
jgi:hypothetical protein